MLLHDILLLASNTLTDEKKRIVRRNDTIAVKQDFQEILEGAKKMQDEKEKNLAGCLEYFTKLDLVEPHNHNSDQDVLSYGFKNSLIRFVLPPPSPTTGGAVVGTKPFSPSKPGGLQGLSSARAPRVVLPRD